jgi:hypothetical protein
MEEKQAEPKAGHSLMKNAWIFTWEFGWKAKGYSKAYRQ